MKYFRNFLELLVDELLSSAILLPVVANAWASDGEIFNNQVKKKHTE